MSQESDQEKTEEATDTRREDFRKRGQVAQTKELASAMFILAATAGVYVLGQFFFENFVELFRYSFGVDMVAAVRQGDLFTAGKLAGMKLAILLAPVAGIAILLALVSSFVQVGFLQVEDALQPKFEKIDPIAGMKRMFSLRALAEGVKSILKMLLIGYLAYSVLKNEVHQIPYLLQFDINQLMTYMATITVKLLGVVGVVMVALAAADYFYQKWELNKQMMMTKQEVKEESKSREGDPLIKARIRKVQREVANRRMMEKVPTADVIVTNPTHIAVALKYGENLPAPQLIAKGGDLVAEKIKEIAKQNNIPIVENIPLARTIFKTMKIGQVIPRELFVAVAEVLSYVYRLKRKAKKS